MISVSELLERARRRAADCVDSGACDAIAALCMAIEQMQPKPAEQRNGSGPLYTAEQLNDAVRGERERIARMVSEEASKNTNLTNATLTRLAKRIRESA